MSRFWNAVCLELMGYCHKHGTNRHEFLGNCSECDTEREYKNDTAKQKKAVLAANLFREIGNIPEPLPVYNYETSNWIKPLKTDTIHSAIAKQEAAHV